MQVLSALLSLAQLIAASAEPSVTVLPPAEDRAAEWSFILRYTLYALQAVRMACTTRTGWD